MSSLSKLLLVAGAVATVALAPSAANAAEGFSGVTADGRLAFIHSDSPAELRTHPKPIKGLASGERVVGLDLAPSRQLLALTSAGRIAALDRATATATATPKFVAPVTAPIDPSAPLTFTVASDGASARIITGGRDVVVDLSTGAATTHPASADAPAVDTAADGRLIGLDAGQNTLVAQAAPGSVPLATLRALPFKALEPTRATVGSDGAVYAVSRLSAKPPLQSRFVRYDPATGRLAGVNGVFLSTELTALAATGAVPDDTTAPTAGLHGRVLRRHVVRGDAYYGGLRVHLSEGGQALASLRLGGKVVGFALGTRFDEGNVALQFFPRRGTRAAMQRAAREHRSLLVHLNVHDWAGNKRAYDRGMHLAR